MYIYSRILDNNEPRNSKINILTTEGVTILWADNETTIDLLGFKVHADLIRSVVTNKKLLPLTIGVFGDWGSGKTSILKMLQHDLSPDSYEAPEEKEKYEKIACLYFNSWLFEGYDDAKTAIISSILLQLGEHQKFGPKVRDKVVSLLKSVNWMRVASLGVKEIALPAIAAYASGGASLVPSLVGAAKGIFKLANSDEKEDEGEEEDGEEDSSSDKNEDKPDWEGLLKKDKSSSSPLDVRSFRERFAKIIKESDIEYLVVLIDDLDRCSPERIIDNLEAVKLFLNVDNTAFVIGADPRIVRHAIATRYKPEEFRTKAGSENDDYHDGQKLINDYLEKLIQVPYYLPRLSPTEIETYMALLFCSRDLDSDCLRKIMDVCEKQRAKNRYSAFGYATIKEALGDTRVNDAFFPSLIFCSSCASLITEGLKGNPRQVKRFLNAFTLRKELAKVADLQNIRDDVLVKLMVLEYAEPDEFSQLFKWQAAQEGFPKQISELEKLVPSFEEVAEKLEDAKKLNNQWATPFMLKWIAMAPKLSEIDLRDYFWIARDRLQSTLSGLSMVSPIIRRILDDLVADNPGKRPVGAKAAKALQEEEQRVLFGFVKKHVLRHPDRKTSYDAIVALIDAGINGSVEVLAQVLHECPAETIPAAMGVVVLGLMQANASVRKILEPEVIRLEKTDTILGRSIKKSREKGKE